MLISLDLPNSFRARLAGEDEPLHGDLADPMTLTVGDYTLGSRDWERVTAPPRVTAGGTQVQTCGILHTTVPVRRQVWVLREAEALRLLAAEGGAR